MFDRGTNYYIMQQGEEIGIFTSSVMWAVQAEDEYSTYNTIFHNTDTLRVLLVCVSEEASNPWKNLLER